MQKRLLSLSVLLFAALLIGSCKKDKKEDPKPKTKTELLTTGSWKFSTATAMGVDVSSFIQPCEKNNIFTFATAGTGNINEGASKCDPSDPDNNAFTWNFASSETVLHVSTPLITGGASDFTIVTLSETQLAGSQTVPPYGNIVVTFVHP